MADPPEPARLLGSDLALCRSYDVALLDLDGVVYVGDHPVVGAPAALEQARAQGMRLAFVTNNASRPPELVASRLSDMGVPAVVAEVTTSAQAAAHYLAERLPSGAAVLVVGGPGLHEALHERGLQPVVSADDRPAAVVQGFDPSVGWEALAEAAIAIRAGARWVATNLDRTIPSPRGALPGNGALVHALAYALGVEPESTGKPDPTMHRESVERSGANRPLVVGDRLDTDIGGAVAAGAASLLVLSGITDAAQLLAAPPPQRPDYLARDLGGLLVAHSAVVAANGKVCVGEWTVACESDGIELRHTANVASTSDGATDDLGDSAARRDRAGPALDRTAADTELDALRALAVASWTQADSEHSTALRTAEDDQAREAIVAWSLG